jgi:hypothetical protein
MLGNLNAYCRVMESFKTFLDLVQILEKLIFITVKEKNSNKLPGIENFRFFCHFLISSNVKKLF